MVFVVDETPRLRLRLAWQVPLTLALGVLAVLAVGIRPALVVPLYLAVIAGELCRVDIAEHRLPNVLVLPGYGFAAVALAWQWASGGEPPWVALAAGAGSFVFLLLMNLAGGMGMGDVKLTGVLGLGLGTLGVLPAIAGTVIGFLAGGVAGIVALVSPGAGALRRIPFGPFLLFGFWATVALAKVYT